MNIETIIDIISKSYSPLSDNCKSDLQSCSKILSFKKLTTLVREGQYSDKTFFIADGCARAYYLKDGKDITDWFAFENEFISSINSFFLNTPSPHYIELLEQTIMVEITRQNMMMLCDKYHDFDRLCRIIVTKTMLQLQQRIVAVQFEPAQQKYENLITIRPDITTRVPLGHIASYLGITFETLSRIRSPKNQNLI
ncbi:MAG: Crp/Fnr family transcriptional regulator [Ginsengibacter sp.]